jgi:N-acetylmuramoyl-L-alanine amidase
MVAPLTFEKKIGHSESRRAAETALQEPEDEAVRHRLALARLGHGPDDFMREQGWVMIAFHNAFRHASGTPIEDALVETVGEGAKYQKGADARKRQVSWHFTVDDTGVYQSLRTNEIGWHTATTKGNNTSIGVEICMNCDLDVPAAYKRAALLVAVLAFQNGLKVPGQIVQHHDWSGKDCSPRPSCQTKRLGNVCQSNRRFKSEVQQCSIDGMAE